MFFLTGALAVGLMLLGELLRRRLGYENEISRKLVHTLHGLCIGVWPFFVGFWIVHVVEGIFVLTVLAAYKLRWFRWMWKVGRKSWGEYMYPLGVIGAAVLSGSNKWIFLAGVLELAIADAAAALVGKQFGGHNSYKVFGQKKSLAGTAAFMLASIGILGGIALLSPSGFVAADFGVIVTLSIVLAAIENIGVYGLDNALLPLATVVLISAL